MDKRDIVRGKAVPVRGNDIDTDRIIPARFMKCVTFNGLGEYAFYDARFTEEGDKKDHPFNESKYSEGTILIVNKNFGCGSSREHAPQALARYGITALIGESFAEIFRGNCTTMGIPTVTLSENDIKELMTIIEESPAQELIIDLNQGKTSLGKKQYDHTIPESFRRALSEGKWDSTALLRDNMKSLRHLEETLPYRF